MRRFVVPLLLGLAFVAALVLLAPAASARVGAATATEGSAEPFCEIHSGPCPDTRTHRDYEGNYVGHDEPAVLFYSNRAGSGNSNEWKLRIPHESSVLPTQDGSGGTWSFPTRGLLVRYGPVRDTELSQSRRPVPG